MKIAFFSAQKYEVSFFNTAFAHDNVQVSYFEQSLNEQTAILAKDHDVVCAFVNDDLSQAVLQILKDLGIQLITLRCAGFNQVDLQAAKAFNIPVTRVPAYSPEAVAEHCIALMLSLSRKTHKAYNRVKEDNFDLNGLLGFNLFQKTVGVIGVGKIGQALIRILQGFGCRILAYDPIAQETDVEYASLDQLFTLSDIVTLHCPLTPETRYMIGASAFQQMKQGVMLINTSRGALLDTKACIQALKEKKLGYLGLDVYEQEADLFFKDLSDEIIQDDDFQRLLTFPNVLITGHQGFFTKEAMEEIAMTTRENVIQWQQKAVLENQID
ncbi:2-hydroxyacid dehydrogenase [Algicola sagamiensis]|uniref:2-hydroxyacid dehydrogenase n=1 Tax=Algicola sagamiensis TaxID=163869 RepID=UPI00047698BD|nr:2-hydroxyacid dehydrogenase [Algicola sagamiensis]